MRVQYIGHSGFLVEMEQIYLLFDYDKGELPELIQKKKLFIFVSHKHQDHYNREIWKLKNHDREVCFVLSKDVPFSAKQRELLGILEEDCKSVVRVRANECYFLEDRKGESIRIDTLKSTDLGVAFLVSYKGYKIYHAGDLNRWVWKGESEVWNRDMAERYTIQLKKLQERLKTDKVTVAFLPLDPRQEEEAFEGICEFLEKISVEKVFPMHLWENYGLIEQCIQVVTSRLSKKEADKIIRITRIGQEWKNEERERNG